MPLLGKQREEQGEDASEDGGGDVDGSLKIEDGGNHIAQKVVRLAVIFLSSCAVLFWG